MIEYEAGKLRHVEHGCVMLVSGDMPGRLATLLRELTLRFEQHQPDCVAVESVFMAKNASSAFKLGQARGVALCAAATAGLAVAEYTPASVKQAIVGRGRADKQQMQHMIRLLLGLREKVQEDAADALGVAICHAHSDRTGQVIARAAAT